jgi:ribonuclease R
MRKPQRTKRSTSREAVTGILRANARGFGFVEPTAGPDIFLPAPLMSGLLDGDTITVDVVDGNAKSVRRLTRSRTIVHGRVIDGIFVIDPAVGSLTAPLKGSFTADEIVAVRLQDRAKGDDITTTVTLVERLGTLENTETLTKVIFNRHQLPVTNTRAQLEEAQRIASRAGKQRKQTRRDLRDQLVVTIDAPHSRDLDDAVAAAVDPDGHIRVWVHIADVAEHIAPGSVIDREALTTPTSVYTPDFVRPMLPEVLAHDVLSLLPGVTRDTVTVEMRISPNGTISAVDVYESLTCSRTRLSYTTVGQILDGRRGKELKGLPDEDLAPAVIDTIGWLWAAASRLGQARNVRGGVDAFRIDSTPGQDRRDDNAHLLIERLMVAANESVARWLTERGIPTLYRVHDPIDAESAGELEKIADAFGVKAHLGRPVTAQAFAAFASSLDATRSAGLWDAILGLLGRARYSTEPTGHFGLGADQYLHFTSPIRRYADLCVHRLVKAYLTGNRDIVGVRDDLADVAAQINPVLRRADLAMRDADRSAALAKVKLTKRNFNGVITSVTSRGMSVLTPAAPVSVFVSSRSLGKGRRIDAQRRVLINADGTTAGVGTRLDVRVVDIDVLSGRIEGSLERSSKAKESHSETAPSAPAKENRSAERRKRDARSPQPRARSPRAQQPRQSERTRPPATVVPIVKTAAHGEAATATETVSRRRRRAAKRAFKP